MAAWCCGISGSSFWITSSPVYLKVKEMTCTQSQLFLLIHSGLLPSSLKHILLEGLWGSGVQKPFLYYVYRNICFSVMGNPILTCAGTARPAQVRCRPEVLLHFPLCSMSSPNLPMGYLNLCQLFSCPCKAAQTRSRVRMHPAPSQLIPTPSRPNPPSVQLPPKKTPLSHFQNAYPSTCSTFCATQHKRTLAGRCWVWIWPRRTSRRFHASSADSWFGTTVPYDTFATLGCWLSIASGLRFK